MSVQITFNTSELSLLSARISALDNSRMDNALLEAAGAEVETQTRRRIQSEKTAPDGTQWAAWSPRYAKTRHGGQSLLQSGDYLLDSINYQVLNKRVVVGSHRIYAATQQVGDDSRNIPARPFLGLSTENEEDLQAILLDTLEQRIR
jgi:phage virion morphogenesis protein